MSEKIKKEIFEEMRVLKTFSSLSSSQLKALIEKSLSKEFLLLVEKEAISLLSKRRKEKHKGDLL